MIRLICLMLTLGSASIAIASDEKSGRFFEDQPDVTDDFQIHFNYLLATDSEDRELDINGKMEAIVLKMNDVMEKATASHKIGSQFNQRPGDGIARKYKLDYRADGSLDITFIRLNKKFKELHKYANNDIVPYLYFEQGQTNPKKIYFNFADFNSVDGGEAGVGFGSLFLRNKSVKSDNRKLLIGLHELLHTQGMGYNCIPGVQGNGNSHYANREIRYMLNSGKKLGPIYAHDEEKCPQLKDSVYLTPTSNDPYDPYQLNCLFKLGKYNHPKFLNVLETLKAKGAYEWRTRFGPSCKTRDMSRDSEGYYLFGSNTNILNTY